MGTGFSKKKKEARVFQEQLTKMQSKMSDSEFIGSAGNGLVTITLNGDGELRHIKIKPECVDPEDIEGLETLIKAAHKDAAAKVKEQAMPELPPGLAGLSGFPGF